MLAQLVHTLSYGDAISGEVLAIKAILDARNLPNQIYAINTHPKYNGITKSLDAIPEQCTLLLHYSLGSKLSEIFKSAKNSKRIIIYHNLTPPEWFKGVNAVVYRDIKQGCLELKELCDVSDLILADSRFNADELKKLGHTPTVLPLPFDPSRWVDPANPRVVSEVRGGAPINFLHVGRLAPNKCIEDIIKIFHFYHHHIDSRSRLWICGIDNDTEIYSFELKQLARELKVDRVINFVGQYDDDEVRALYESCSAYICMSEHEGFCLPLLEAMHFGLPVVAFESSAVGETVGEGGVIVDKKDHFAIAHLLNKLSKDDTMRLRCIAAGRARAAAFSLKKFADNLLSILGLV